MEIDLYISRIWRLLTDFMGYGHGEGLFIFVLTSLKHGRSIHRVVVQPRELKFGSKLMTTFVSYNVVF